MRGSQQDKGEARRRIATTSITPPLRGSRQDKGASPPSSRWGVINRQYSQQTLQNANALRQNQTNAEGLLWHYLRNKQMDGHKFRRQQPIGPYIVDFACMPRKLIVELDGGQHAKQEAYDEKRDTFLQDKGYRILRFWNNEVFENCFGVLESIYNALHHHPPLEGGSKDASLSERGSPPPHQPSPAGSVSATPPRGGSDFHGEAMKDEFRGNTPQGGSEWTPERTRAYLDGMDDDIMSLFPDSFEDSELGKIPKGWEVKSLGDVVELAYGKALKADNRRGGNVPVFGSNGQIGWHDEKLVERSGIVVGRKGNPGVVTWVSTDFFPIDTTFYVVPKDGKQNLHFLFYALKGQDLYSIAADSAVPGLNRNLVYMNKQLVPPDQLVSYFNKYTAILFARRQYSENESRTLVALRDILLPKLISGKVRVTAGDKIAENTI